MKSETLEEQRNRLVELSNREKDGLKKVQEGQLVAPAGQTTDPDSVEGQMLQRHSDERVRQSVNDIPDKTSISSPKETGAPAPKEGNDEGKNRNDMIAEGARVERRQPVRRGE